MKLLKSIASKASDRQSGHKGSASSRHVRNNFVIPQGRDGGENVGEANAAYQGHHAEVSEVSPERTDTVSRAAIFSSSSDDDHDENTALRAMQESDSLIAPPASSSLRSSVHHSVSNHERAEAFPTGRVSHRNRPRHEIETLDISDSSEDGVDLAPPLRLVNTPRSILRELPSPNAHAQAHACARSHISPSDGHAKTEKTSFAYNVTDSEDESSIEGEATGQHRALRQEGLLASPLRHFDHGVGASADARFAR
jgi:hypothetical protein